MNYLPYIAFVLFLLGFSPTQFANAKGDSCACEKVTCGPCEMSQTLKFYTEKCEKGTKVKSCARPVCVALDPMPEHCVAKNKSKERNIASTGPKKETHDMTQANVEIGTVMSVKGGAWIKSTLGKKKPIKKNMKVYESDTIITGTKGGVEIEFLDTNIIFINEKTKIKMTEYRKAKKINERKAIMDLQEGQVRSRVKVKYQGAKGSYFRVRSRSAVAGVRGTDFVMEYYPGKKKTTKVSTLSGVVRLYDRKSLENYEKEELYGAPAKKQPDTVTIKKGMFASHIVDNSKVFNKTDMEKLKAKGFLTPVYKLSRAEIQKIKGHNSMAGLKVVAKKKKKLSQGICSKPFGDYNQCQWHCQNNPNGQSECRTDLPHVKCVRKRCNANGVWTEESRIPASENYRCEPYGYRVNKCDY